MKYLGSLLVLACILLFPLQTQAQLIGDPVDPSAYDLDVSSDDSRPEILRKRYVSLKDWTMGPQLSLSLFPDTEVLSYVEEIDLGEERKTWKGHVPGDDAAYVIISEQEGIYYGKIVDADMRSFQLIYKGSSVYAIYEIEPSNIPLDEEDQVILEAADEIEGDEGICEQSYSCPAATIDILIVYTPAAKDEMGGQAAIEAAIASAVSEMNTVNDNSGVPHDYNLVHTEEINFTESGSSSTDLGALRSQTDGKGDNVHQLRYIHRADLVAMISSSSYCGIGYVPNSKTYFDASSGFSITGVNCMTGNLTLAHECGHNMGLHHDYYVSSSTRPCSHHHGYVNQNAQAANNKRWRTVMAYNDNCSDAFGFYCSRIPYWSNPDQDYNGDPMGVSIGNSQPSNNAFALTRSSCLVSGMSDQLVSFPVIYQDWQVEAKDQEISLNWATAQEINNSGFEIEIRSDSAKDFQKLGFIAGKGNSTEVQSYSFKVRHAFPGVHYLRLKQIDHDGTFAYSSIKEVEIGKEEQVYHRAYPNPSEGLTTLEFILYRSSEYQIDIMDINGQLVRKLYKGELKTGDHRFELNTEELNPGMYFYSIRSLIDQEMGKLWVR
ncbi:MAG: zinc-dependent metalloprotease [Bacteroidia bacterium]|nr:zinc-dependent metalloprotease [Bacteroidia bacterium]